MQCSKGRSRISKLVPNATGLPDRHTTGAFWFWIYVEGLFYRLLNGFMFQLFQKKQLKRKLIETFSTAFSHSQNGFHTIDSRCRTIVIPAPSLDFCRSREGVTVDCDLIFSFGTCNYPRSCKGFLPVRAHSRVVWGLIVDCRRIMVLPVQAYSEHQMKTEVATESFARCNFCTAPSFRGGQI